MGNVRRSEPTSEASGLTVRQKEIMEFLRLGCTNQEISRFLNISVNTVKTHVAALYRELDVGNRTEAVHRFHQASPPAATAAATSLASAPGGAGGPSGEGTCPATPPAIAVLPFTSPEGSIDLAREAIALTETVSLHLSRWRRFPVIAPEACSGCRPEEVLALSRKLGASHVVVAGLQGAGDAKRLSLRLLSTPEGELHWAQVFEIPAARSTVGVEPIGAHVGAALMPALLGAHSKRMAGRSIESLQPWEKAIQGLHLLETRTPRECRMATELFVQALALAPDLALAHYGLSLGSYLGILEQWEAQPELAKERVHEHARTCVRLDPGSADTSLAMALSRLLEGRLEEAISLLLEAVRYNPGSVSAFSLLGQLHAMRGGVEAGCRYLEESVRLSVHTPSYIRSQGSLALMRFAMGDYAGVVACCRTGLLYDAGYIGFHALLVSASALSGEPDAAAMGEALFRSKPEFRLESLAPFLRSIAPPLVTRFLEGLRLAGFPVPASGQTHPFG